MRCLRIYATPDGESHFGEANIPTTSAPLFPNEAPFDLSAQFPASQIRFVHVPSGQNLTVESFWGFLRGVRRAILAHAHWDFAFRFGR
jgi:hypothetical protein